MTPSPRRLRVAAVIALAAATSLSAAPAPAQPKKSAVAAIIRRGGELFEDQQYEESIQTLSAALLRSGTTDAEKIEVYRLLAYNYIILKRGEEGDSAVRAILVLSEKFALAPSESPRFRDFFDAAKKRWIEEGKPGKASGAAAAVVEKPIHIQHISPAQSKVGMSIKLDGTIDDPDGRVRGVQLAYRAGSSGKFLTIAATFTMGSFRTRIPGLSVKPPLVEYYIQAVDKGGLPILARGDAAAPLRIVVQKESSVASSPFLWVPLGAAIVGGAVTAAILLTRSPGTSNVTIGIKE